jgi:hypothetical protein
MNRAQTQEDYIEFVLNDMDMNTALALAKEHLEQTVGELTDSALRGQCVEFGVEITE